MNKPLDFDMKLNSTREIIDDIKEALERERIAEQSLGWSVILSPTPAFRRMLLVGIGTAIAQQAVG